MTPLENTTTTLELSQSNFDAEVKEETQVPVLVDFWAPWCGPCKAIAPILEELAKDMEGSLKVCKVNVDENKELSAKFGVSSIPTLCLFKEGEVVETSVGMVGSKEELKTKLGLQ